MDVALCTLDGIEYTGNAFERLDPIDKASKRRHLVCVRCKTPAFFRKKAKSGQAACFGARPHENCSLAAAETTRGEGGGPDRDILYNPGNHIIIDVQFGGGAAGPFEPNGQGESSGRGGRFTGHGQRPNAVMHRRLRPLLRTLIYSQAFRRSDQTIELPEHGVWTVHELFVNFADISNADIGRFKGFWGVVYDIGYGANGTLWINTGKREDVSIPLSEEQRRPFQNYHRVDPDDLEGIHILAFGTLKCSPQGKLWIDLSDIEYFAICDD